MASQHRLGRGAAARGVGRGDAEPGQQIEHTGAGIGVDAAHRDGGQLCARRDQCLLEHREIRRAAGAHDKPRAELTTRNRQL
jgi:hypothetical protein